MLRGSSFGHSYSVLGRPISSRRKRSVAFGMLFPSISFARKIPYDRTYVNTGGFSHKLLNTDKTLEPLGPYPRAPPKEGKTLKALNLPKSELGGGGEEPIVPEQEGIDIERPKSDLEKPSSSQSVMDKAKEPERIEERSEKSSEASNEQLNKAVQQAQSAFERVANFGIQEEEISAPPPKKRKSAKIEFTIIPD